MYMSAYINVCVHIYIHMYVCACLCLVQSYICICIYCLFVYGKSICMHVSIAHGSAGTQVRERVGTWVRVVAILPSCSVFVLYDSVCACAYSYTQQ
jgi:hypothetical protein